MYFREEVSHLLYIPPLQFHIKQVWVSIRKRDTLSTMNTFLQKTLVNVRNLFIDNLIHLLCLGMSYPGIASRIANLYCIVCDMILLFLILIIFVKSPKYCDFNRLYIVMIREIVKYMTLNYIITPTILSLSLTSVYQKYFPYGPIMEVKLAVDNQIARLQA